MKLILIILVFSFSVMALNSITVPKTFTSNEKIYASDFNQNFDSLESWISKNQDSIDTKFIRFSDFDSGDSTLKRIQIDTIRSNPNIDSISGSPKIDSITVSTGIRSRVTGNVVGNITGNVTGNETLS